MFRVWTVTAIDTGQIFGSGKEFSLFPNGAFSSRGKAKEKLIGLYPDLKGMPFTPIRHTQQYALSIQDGRMKYFIRPIEVHE